MHNVRPRNDRRPENIIFSLCHCEMTYLLVLLVLLDAVHLDSRQLLTRMLETIFLLEARITQGDGMMEKYGGQGGRYRLAFLPANSTALVERT
jgi:hypothetical protein